MLILGSHLINMPVMSLQTGSKLAVIDTPVIDPSNLKIIAYKLEGPLLAQRPSFLLISDVREISSIGLIVDSADEFIGSDDVIVVKKIIELGFKLVNIDVFEDTRHKLGKVIDYNIDSSSFVVQQLHVKQSLIKSLSNSDLLVNRSQIIAIDDRKIIVKSNTQKNKTLEVTSQQLSYINPFRSKSSPQTEGSNTAS